MGRTLRQLRSGEHGVIALATFSFICTMGFAIVIALWGIGYVSGAFNTLYAANQSAAYAAATATVDAELSDGDTVQARFACAQRSTPTTCRGGAAFEAAQEVIQQSFSGQAAANFGLFYTPGSAANAIGQVHMVGPSRNFDGSDQIQLYEIAVDPASAKMISPGCSPPPTRDHVAYVPGPGQPAATVCWRLREFGQRFPAQYQSAVVVRSRATIPMLPFCSGQDWCPNQTLVVAAAASQDQPAPPSGYGQYFPAG